MTSQRKPSAVEVASQSTKAGASASVFAQFLQRSRELAPDELVLFAEAGFARELKTFADQFAINMMHIPKMSLGGLGNQYHFKRSLLFPCFSTLCWANGLNFLSSGDRAVRSGVRLSDGSISTWTSSPNSVAYPEAPSGLLMMLRRPGRQSLCGVQVSNTILGVILDQMDFQHFDEVSICSLAVSSVHATHGSGRQIFVERISADQKFSMFRYRLLRLWDETEREIHYGNYRWDSYKDLNRLLSEHGSALRIGRSKVGIDAELVDVSRGVDRVVAVSPEQFLTVGATLGTIEDGVEEGNWKGVSGKSVSALTDLSGQFCTVLDGDLRVMYLEENDEIKGRRCWKSVSPRAFSDHFSNRRIECEGRKTMPLGKAWLEWPKRPSAIGLTFDASKSPTSSIESRIVNGRLNLWSGFGCIPQEKIGGWSCLAAMIRDDLCGGNEEYYQYVLRWIAFKIQNPGLPCETSLVFKGPKGVGKTTLGEIMIEIFGSHGLVVSRRSQFAGQFSGHLATACFVFADEAVWGGNKEDEGTLKKLITDRHVLYRAMYKEETYGVNRVGLMMATNEDWAVPATFEERRFVVLEVNNRHQVSNHGLTTQEKAAREQYWDTVHREIRAGGREAFMFDMLNLPLEDWNPRIGAPRTAALAAQIEQGLRGIQRWYFEMLTEARLPGDLGEDVQWVESQQISASTMLRDCREWMRAHKQAAIVSHRSLLKELKPLGWLIGVRTSTMRTWRAPSLKEAVSVLENRLGRKLF